MLLFVMILLLVPTDSKLYIFLFFCRQHDPQHSSVVLGLLLFFTTGFQDRDIILVQLARPHPPAYSWEQLSFFFPQFPRPPDAVSTFYGLSVLVAKGTS